MNRGANDLCRKTGTLLAIAVLAASLAGCSGRDELLAEKVAAAEAAATRAETAQRAAELAAKMARSQGQNAPTAESTVEAEPEDLDTGPVDTDPDVAAATGT